MKKFVEKLIKRLEEQKRREFDERDEMYNLGTEHAISEVNQLAKEYDDTDDETNLFKEPLTKEEQKELSNFLDGYTQWFENYFDEDDPDNDFHGDLMGLYKMVKLLENRTL